MPKKEQFRTQVKKRLFIEFYKKFLGSVRATCDKVGIERKTYHNWMNNDPEFRLEVKDVFQESLEDMEEKLNMLILKGNGPAIRFWLSRRHPDFMRRR
ncbi:MAG: hypothetical protein PHF35_03295 [Candidatus Moranbacteria bacterium]|nr:hypothetical protein [Candidatus Moranbacteria bacterium]